MDWFEKLTGFREESPQQVRNNLVIEQQKMRSLVNGKVWIAGRSEFAWLILEAAYEATICTAILNAQINSNSKLFLTLLGGGAFGNDTSWIIDSIARALLLYQDIDLDVAIVSYGSSKPSVQKLLENFS